ncbi:unnamed protein product [Phytomonas sp. Hart1]|nr:unnamed protein product [Phytomonas sp. Hart1]|eukprot:CCW70629.1 unnamed protein product [Phytomonas sp. isolate Hart1]
MALVAPQWIPIPTNAIPRPKKRKKRKMALRKKKTYVPLLPQRAYYDEALPFLFFLPSTTTTPPRRVIWQARDSDAVKNRSPTNFLVFAKPPYT